MQLQFVVTNKTLNESSNRDLVVEEKITIGRHLGSPIALQGDRLSRHHFSLMVVDGVLTIENLSSNGTWLNGSLLNAKMRALVKSEDIIEVPGYEMRVMVQEAEVPPGSQAPSSSASPSKEASFAGKPPLAALQILEPAKLRFCSSQLQVSHSFFFFYINESYVGSSKQLCYFAYTKQSHFHHHSNFRRDFSDNSTRQVL